MKPMTKHSFLVLLALSALLSPVCNVLAQVEAATDPVLSAAYAELQRSFGKLKNAEKPPLYYLAYEISDISEYNVEASMGDISSESQTRRRVLDVDARVGSMALDNTHQLKGEKAASERSRWKSYVPYELPLEDDGASIRTQLWLATDKEYKSSLQNYMKVEMNKAVTTEEENPAPDFSAAPSVSYYERLKPFQVDKEAWKQKLRTLSAECKKYP
ncbi:MAG TPA: hypothetical protein PLL10_08690, partial [Elusimicrobiales bacterium]|nr:hypothetical protein [Elusimicrobiales bacterium]